MFYIDTKYGQIGDLGLLPSVLFDNTLQTQINNITISFSVTAMKQVFIKFINIMYNFFISHHSVILLTAKLRNQ